MRICGAKGNSLSASISFPLNNKAYEQLKYTASRKGYFDDVPVDRIKECQNAWEAVMQDQHPDLLESILKEKDLTPEIDAGLKAAIESFKLSWN